MPTAQNETKQNKTQYRQCDISKAKARGEGDISSVFSSFGNGGNSALPEKYAEIKKNLIENKDELKPAGID